MSKLIDRATLQARLAGGTSPILIEALPEKYYHDWHLPGARHMPHDQVEALAPRVVPDKTAPIVVYCASQSCQNSHIAAARLTQLGYTDVAVYAGGKADWQSAELPIERSPSAAVA
jgi:rhodanese-related sulfurtransferase